MTVSTCSLEAFTYAQRTLSKRQNQVLTAIKYLKQASNNDIAAFLNRPINTVTGRVKELRQKGLVQPFGKKKSIYGQTETVWEAVYPIELFN